MEDGPTAESGRAEGPQDAGPTSRASRRLARKSARRQAGAEGDGTEAAPGAAPPRTRRSKSRRAAEPAEAAPGATDPQALAAAVAVPAPAAGNGPGVAGTEAPRPARLHVDAPAVVSQPDAEPAPASGPAPASPVAPMPEEYRSKRSRKRSGVSAPASAPTAPAERPAPTVRSARARPRHYGVLAAFLLIVILPTVSHAWYLWTRAEDQFESRLGFGSRTEEGPATFDVMSALAGGSQTGSRDMDILYQFVTSQELVAKIDRDLDLETIWARPAEDVLNRFSPGGTIEDLVAFWQRMVRVDYDPSTGLMNLRVFAFDPVDAQTIAQAILRESTEIVNSLSKAAQDDVTQFSKQMLDETQSSLSDARLAVLDYQVRNNIVDPSNIVANQLSVVSMLNQELTNTEVELDLLVGTLPANDPRIAALQRKIEAINNRIASERAKVGAEPGEGSPGFAKLMADFEKLKVEQDFAQQAYLAALAAHNQALADAQKKTRYLATYVEPTLAEAATAPNRPLNAVLTALIGFLAWVISILTFYALRDRR